MGGDGWNSEKLERLKIIVKKLPEYREKIGEDFYDEHVVPLLPLNLEDREIIELYIPIDTRRMITYYPGVDEISKELILDLANECIKEIGKDKTQYFRLHLLLHLLTEDVQIYARSFFKSVLQRLGMAQIPPGSMVSSPPVKHITH